MLTTYKLSEIISPSFAEVHKSIKANEYTHYMLNGGRGSTKSSFAAVEIILGLLSSPDAHAVALRAVGNTLHDSVFQQLLWAIDKLGVTRYFKATVSPMQITYTPTGQTILFRGADDPIKIKSIKAPFGYFKYAWYEEFDQYRGMDEIRNINQSLMRGGSSYAYFYTYNPPISVQSWVNTEAQIKRDDRLLHHSTYLDVPKEWLGEQFLIEAEHLKKVQPDRYEHEYMGVPTGTGGEVFKNVALEKITDEQLAGFDHIRRGLDWGYAVDPFAYVTCHYDKTRRTLYIFDEIYKVGLPNRMAAEMIKKINPSNGLITADSAEPKSIQELDSYGLHICGAVKGPDSVKHGTELLISLDKIIIDPERCPNAAREFTQYELEQDKNGLFKACYPDKNNHTIDAVRYAMEQDSRNVVIR